MINDRKTLLSALLNAYATQTPDLDLDTYAQKLNIKSTTELVEIAQTKFPSLLEGSNVDEVLGIDPNAPEE